MNTYEFRYVVEEHYVKVIKAANEDEAYKIWNDGDLIEGADEVISTTYLSDIQLINEEGEVAA
jgi:hypothetical protein